MISSQDILNVLAWEGSQLLGRAALENICCVKLCQQMQNLLLKLAPENRAGWAAITDVSGASTRDKYNSYPWKARLRARASHPGGGVKGRCEGRFRTPNADFSVIPETNGWFWSHKVCWYFAFLNLGILHKVNSCFFKRNPRPDWKVFEAYILRFIVWNVRGDEISVQNA